MEYKTINRKEVREGMTEVSISPLWKDRILDLIRIVAILFCFYTIFLVISGDWVKYNMPVIITAFMSITIVCIIIMGEKIRSSDPILAKLEADYQRLKNKN